MELMTEILTLRTPAAPTLKTKTCTCVSTHSSLKSSSPGRREGGYWASAQIRCTKVHCRQRGGGEQYLLTYDLCYCI